MKTNEKAIVREFASISGASEKIAVELCKKYNFRLEVALDAFFNGPSQQQSRANVDTSKLEAVLAKYTGLIVCQNLHFV